MLATGIAIGALLTAQKGWKYAVIAAILVGLAQILDAAHGPEVGQWLSDRTKDIFS